MKADIQRLAALVGPGDSIRTTCPVCAATHEDSFLVRRDANDAHIVWYRCYRAKCGVGGRYHDIQGLTMSVTDRESGDFLALANENVPRPIMVSLAEQLAVPLGWLYTQDLRYDPIEDAVMYPWNNICENRITQVGYQSRGWSVKHLRNYRTAPNSLLYSVPKGPWSIGSRVVFVENIWSAYKVCELGARGVALMGHAVGPNVASQLRSQGVTEAIFILDPDTWPKGIIAALRNAEAAGIAACAAQVDFKPHRMSQEALKEVISNTRS